MPSRLPEDSRCLSCLPEAIPVFQNDRVVTYYWGVSSMADLKSLALHTCSVQCDFPTWFRVQNKPFFPTCGCVVASPHSDLDRNYRYLYKTPFFPIFAIIKRFCDRTLRTPVWGGTDFAGRIASHVTSNDDTACFVDVWNGLGYATISGQSDYGARICFDHFIPQSVPR